MDFKNTVIYSFDKQGYDACWSAIRISLQGQSENQPNYYTQVQCDSSQYEYHSDIAKELRSDCNGSDGKRNSIENSNIESEFVIDNNIKIELENNTDVKNKLNDDNDVQEQATEELKYDDAVRQELKDNINIGQKFKNDSTTVRKVLRDELESNPDDNISKDPMITPSPSIVPEILSPNTLVTFPDHPLLPSYELIELPKAVSQCSNESNDDSSTSDEEFINNLSNNQIKFDITNINDKPDYLPLAEPTPRMVKVEFTVDIPISKIKRELKVQLLLNVTMDGTTIINSETRKVQIDNNKVNDIVTTKIKSSMSSELPKYLKQFYGLPCFNNCHPTYTNPACKLHSDKYKEYLYHQEKMLESIEKAAKQYIAAALNDHVEQESKELDQTSKDCDSASESCDTATEECDSATEEYDSATEKCDSATEDYDSANEESDSTTEESDSPTEDSDFVPPNYGLFYKDFTPLPSKCTRCTDSAAIASMAAASASAAADSAYAAADSASSAAISAATVTITMRNWYNSKDKQVDRTRKIDEMVTFVSVIFILVCLVAFFVYIFT